MYHDKNEIVLFLNFSKRTVMEHKGIELNELQLFHGTSPDSVVHAIFRQNFDPRLCGRNMVAYGKGSYFARDASYNDKYTCQSGQKIYLHSWSEHKKAIAKLTFCI